MQTSRNTLKETIIGMLRTGNENGQPASWHVTESLPAFMVAKRRRYAAEASAEGDLLSRSKHFDDTVQYSDRAYDENFSIGAYEW